jgi:hypothetical protein
MKDIDFKDIDNVIDDKSDEDDNNKGKKNINNILGMTETPNEYYARLKKEKLQEESHLATTLVT